MSAFSSYSSSSNYISPIQFSLVTSLESVVLQLQDSCRESRAEASELRQENARLAQALDTLRHETREREKYLRALWHARKGADDPHVDDFPPPPPSFSAIPQSASSSGSIVSSTNHPSTVAYPNPQENLDPRLQYSAHTDSPVSIGANAYHDGSGSAYGDRSPSVPFVTHDGDPVGVNGRPIDPHRVQKLSPYPVFVSPNTAREPAWGGVGQSTSSVNDQHENGTATHSPAYMPSPTVTSAEMQYGPRYAMDMAKNVLPSIDTAPYVFTDRSISPAGSSPHTSQASVSSQFPFVYTGDGQERNDGDYRRHQPQAPEMTLHGGTADVSAYAVNRRRASNGPERPMLGGLAGGVSSFRQNDEERSFNEGDGKAGPSDVRAGIRRPRRNTSQSGGASHSSRSPSPSHPPISSTLAVIKAQAFGALRRTRARPKKSTEGAAKMAMEVLEARGIGLGLGTGSSHKRPRLHDEDSLQS